MTDIKLDVGTCRETARINVDGTYSMVLDITPVELMTVSGAAPWSRRSAIRRKHDKAKRSSPGNNYEEQAWEKLWETIRTQAANHRMSDMDVFVAWRLGYMAWNSSKQMGAKFPHDRINWEDVVESIRKGGTQ